MPTITRPATRARLAAAAVSISVGCVVTACGSAAAKTTPANPPPSSKQTQSPTAAPTPSRSPSRSASPVVRTLTSCQLLTKAEVEQAFGVTVTTPHIDPELPDCRYDAPDAATGGLNFGVYLSSPGGVRAYTQLKAAYQQASGAIQPGQYTLINGVGTDAFIAIDLGGAWTAAAYAGDTEVSVQVGGTTFQNQVDPTKAGTGIRHLLQTALNRAADGTPAS